MDKYERWLTLLTFFDGLGYMGFAPIVYFVKIGYVWHDALWRCALYDSALHDQHLVDS